jgi:Recombinase
VVRNYEPLGAAIHLACKALPGVGGQIQAAVVRRIFTDFAAGKSPRRVAAELNREAYPVPAVDLGATRRSADMRSVGQVYCAMSSMWGSVRPQRSPDA